MKPLPVPANDFGIVVHDDFSQYPTAAAHRRAAQRSQSLRRNGTPANGLADGAAAAACVDSKVHQFARSEFALAHLFGQIQPIIAVDSERAHVCTFLNADSRPMIVNDREGFRLICGF
jgi:hypothetical protein